MLNQTDMLHQMESKSSFFIRLAGICGCSKWGFCCALTDREEQKECRCIRLREWFVCCVAPRSSQKLSRFEWLSALRDDLPARWCWRDHPSLSSVCWT